MVPEGTVRAVAPTAARSPLPLADRIPYRRNVDQHATPYRFDRIELGGRQAMTYAVSSEVSEHIDGWRSAPT